MFRNRWRIGFAALTAAAGTAAIALLAAGPAPTLTAPPAEESRCVWWNEETVSVLSMGGSFAVGSEGAVVRFRPEHEGCSITLLVEPTGELLEYSVTDSGEVVLAHGWVIVNQGGRDVLNMDGGSSSGTCDFPSDCDALFTREEVSNVDYSGDCWQSVEDPGQGCKWAKFCSSSGSEGCTVTITTIDGQSYTYASACGGGLEIRQCQAYPEGTMLCVCTP